METSTDEKGDSCDEVFQGGLFRQARSREAVVFLVAAIIVSGGSTRESTDTHSGVYWCWPCLLCCHHFQSIFFPNTSLTSKRIVIRHKLVPQDGPMKCC